MSPHCQVHRTVWLTGDFCLQLCYADGPQGTVMTFQPCAVRLPIRGNGGTWGDKQCTLWKEMYSEARSDAKWKECDKVSMGLWAFLASPRDHSTVLSHAPQGWAKNGIEWKSPLGTGSCQLPGRPPDPALEEKPLFEMVKTPRSLFCPWQHTPSGSRRKGENAQIQKGPNWHS